MKILNLITTPLAIAGATMIYGILAHYAPVLPMRGVLVGMGLIFLSFGIRQLVKLWKK